jgi:hypothetical protein
MQIERRTALAAALAGLAFADIARGVAAAERHPHIRAAVSALQAAKVELQTADHDFGGHRVDAIKACDGAIQQLTLALQFDHK